MPLNDITTDGAQVSDETLAEIPEELARIISAKQEKRDALIGALGESIKKKLESAKRARAASGIETEWMEDEEHYESIDEANRGESKLIKPNHPSGVVTEKKAKKKNKSTVFFNITRQYVDSAAASVSEMGNPTDDRNFSLRPTPVPELTEHKDNQTPVPDTTNELGESVQAVVADFVSQEIEIANKKAKAAQTRIDDWLVECQYHAAHRRVIHDAAKSGTGILKGPFPSIQKRRKTIKGEDGKMAMEIMIETNPASKRVSCWRIFPDPTCFESIHDGEFIFELDYTNGGGVTDMKLLPGYLPEQIDKVMKEGPRKLGNTEYDNKVSPAGSNVSDQYEVWYYYGHLNREEIIAMGITDSLDPEQTDDKKALDRIEKLESCPCIVTMINDVIVRASLNPLDSGDFPYDLFTWEEREGMVWGRGVSRIMRNAQRVVNAGIRNLLDNAALSGGVQVGFKKGSIRPMGGGEWKLDPITFWELTDEDARSINDCLSFHQIPTMQKELLGIIQFGQKMAEDVTGMPLMLQGQTGSAPDTVGGMQLLNKNATATRRMIARKLDDQLTEPHIRRYYDWVLMYGDESEKGDFSIDARGSQALVERDIQRQFSIQMLANALQPQFGVDPYKAMTAVLRAEMIDPKTWQLKEEDFKKKMDSQANNAPPVLQIAEMRAKASTDVASIRAQAVDQAAKLRADAEVQAAQVRGQKDLADAQGLATKNQMDNDFRYKELEINREIEMLRYATQQKISLDDVKANLATTTMKLQVEKELAGAAQMMQQATHASEQRLNAATHVSDHVHAAAASDAQRTHDQTIDQLNRDHAQKLQAMQHAHDINVAGLRPEVQIPGRAGDGQALSQMPE